ncbi:MAG: TIGR00282 family metallophosphoesterase [Candidatus Zixiibacteriota bacterium]
MKILFIADIFGKAGKYAVYSQIDELKKEYKPDIIIANGENIAGGFGITPNLASKLFHYGVDVITLGNHTFDRKEIEDYLDDNDRIIRPYNFPPGNHGRGKMVYEFDDGRKLGIAVLQGRIFMNNIDCPFRAADEVITQLREETVNIFVDFHAETTSEKRAFGNYLDGRVSAVCGTHTHVQTSDNQILKGGTAFITDCGMTGPHDSVIGVKTDLIVKHLISGRRVYFSPSKQGARLQGVVVDIDDDTGYGQNIDRLDIEVEGFRDD